MKHRIANNWGLKLGSLIFAFFLWIIVTNMNDPVISYKINNVKVRFTNTNVITDEGETYVVLDDTDVIDTVTITAPRSIIDSLSEDNVVAVADFAKNLDREMGTVDIELSTNKYASNLESITGDIKKVKLDIEALKSKTLALKTITSGTVSDGYIIGDVSTAQNQVRISGPESVINQVSRAEVEVSVTGFTQNIVTDADIKLLDALGEPIESGNITTNIRTVKVDVELLETKDVKVSFGTIGVPADGYAANGIITSNPSTILVAGKSSALKDLEEIKVDPSAINITGQMGDMLTLVDIRQYLPTGVKLADATSDGNISVTVFIEKTVNRKVTLDASGIKLKNIPEGYKVEIVDPEETYDVNIKGLQKLVYDIDPAEVTATADLANALEQQDIVGSLYHVNLEFATTAGSLEVASPVQIWFKLLEE